MIDALGHQPLEQGALPIPTEQRAAELGDLARKPVMVPDIITASAAGSAQSRPVSVDLVVETFPAAIKLHPAKAKGDRSTPCEDKAIVAAKRTRRREHP